MLLLLDDLQNARSAGAAYVFVFVLVIGMVGVPTAFELGSWIGFLRFVRQDDDDLSAQVHVCKIVIAVLQSLDSIAKKYNGSCHCRGIGRLRNPRQIEVVVELVAFLLCTGVNCEGDIRVVLRGQREIVSLEIGAIVAQRFEAKTQKLGCDVAAGDAGFMTCCFASSHLL